MTPEELRKYKMTSAENQKWNEVVNLIREYCRGIVPVEYEMKIEYHLSDRAYEHHVGFCESDGYYYIAEGDRGKVECLCKSFDKDEMLIYLMKNILRDVGQSMELKIRHKEQIQWRFYEDDAKTVPGHIAWVENSMYRYSEKYDSRKWWFEYILKGLISVFGIEKVSYLIEDFTANMNYWFREKHWDFDRESFVFVEISESVEYNKI